jgi:hypothetical protein
MSVLVLGGWFDWMKLDRYHCLRDWGRIKNGIPTPALNAILNSFFLASTLPTPYYIGLIGVANYTGINDQTDTMSNHPGWQEFQNYAEAARPAWNALTASGGILTNPVPLSFTMLADSTIKGIFVTNSPTKGGTSGLLWATGLANTDQTYLGGEIMKVVYTLPAVNS